MKSNKDIKKFFSTLNKKNPYGSTLKETKLTTPKEWIDTGSYALNAILSGSLYKGVPVGRITGFEGESGGGKSLITQKIAGNAQDLGYYPVIWDSEFAIDRQTAENLGVDPENAMWYPAGTIESVRNQISEFLARIIELNLNDPEPQKFIIILDSLANLPSQKESEDVLKDKDASDVGQRAKAIKSMLRILTYQCGIAGVPFVFTNHVYEGMEPYPTAFKKSSGGKGPVYMSSIVAQMNSKKEKNEDDDKISDNSNYSGVSLNVTTVKNRFIPQFLKTSLYLSFKTGLDRYAGLREIAEDVGLIHKPDGKRNYVMNGESIGFRSAFEKSPEFWDSAMPELEKLVNEKYRFSQQQEAEMEAIEQEMINEIDS